jgi:hypothetical protein
MRIRKTRNDLRSAILTLLPYRLLEPVTQEEQDEDQENQE